MCWSTAIAVSGFPITALSVISSAIWAGLTRCAASSSAMRRGRSSSSRSRADRLIAIRRSAPPACPGRGLGDAAASAQRVRRRMLPDSSVSGMNCSGGTSPEARMLPAHEPLGAVDLRAREIELGLVVQA
jgi:hypothetical protein